MTWIFEAENWIGLLTLTALEIVLGIDNIVFISILSGRLPQARRSGARRWGLMLALGMRVLLLLSLTWIMGLTRPFLSIAGIDLTGKGAILIGGGLFLLAKSTREIHHRVEDTRATLTRNASSSFSGVLLQIVLLDIVFSLDSVITAVGMVNEIGVMIAAVIVAMLIMMISANAVASFIEQHPTLKMLALSFLLLIGVNLTAEGVGFHIPKGYTYFAMGFSLLVELLNIKAQKKASIETHA
jgi:predicted tellurium resistance membrane protein TerC